MSTGAGGGLEPRGDLGVSTPHPPARLRRRVMSEVCYLSSCIQWSLGTAGLLLGAQVTLAVSLYQFKGQRRVATTSELPLPVTPSKAS